MPYLDIVVPWLHKVSIFITAPVTPAASRHGGLQEQWALTSVSWLNDSAAAEYVPEIQIIIFVHIISAPPSFLSWSRRSETFVK